nr:hypothetical protein CFP56_67866 [Quercus suber]
MKNAILVPGYYEARKKMNSGTSAERDSGRKSGSGGGKMPVQSQGVTVGSDDSIESDINSSSIRNKVDAISKEAESILEANNEEVCLAKEFGAATLLGSTKRSSKAPKNPSSHDNLSGSSQLKKARDSQEARDLCSGTKRTTPTWTRRERKIHNSTADTSPLSGKKKRGSKNRSRVT